jgi:hypothetical protein
MYTLQNSVGPLAASLASYVALQGSYSDVASAAAFATGEVDNMVFMTSPANRPTTAMAAVNTSMAGLAARDATAGIPVSLASNLSAGISDLLAQLSDMPSNSNYSQPLAALRMVYNTLPAPPSRVCARPPAA